MESEISFVSHLLYLMKGRNDHIIHFKLCFFNKNKASIGSILGLGFGFSIISAFEVIYYLCFRWYFKKTSSHHQETPIIQLVPDTENNLNFPMNQLDELAETYWFPATVATEEKYYNYLTIPNATYFVSIHDEMFTITSG